MSKSREIGKEEKLAIVGRCLSGELGVCEASRQMGVVQESIRRWIYRYQTEGEEGLQEAQDQRKDPKKLKEAAVKDYMSGKWSMLNRQFHANMPNEKWLTAAAELMWHEGSNVHKLYLDCTTAETPGTAQSGGSDTNGKTPQLSIGSIKNFRQPKAGHRKQEKFYFISLSA